MKSEKHILVYKGEERAYTLEQGRNFIATDIATQFSGNGATPEQAVAALVRSLDLPVVHRK